MSNKERTNMELELKKQKLSYCDKILDTTVSSEETLETIVPDACPDILRIIDTEGKVLIRGKEAQDGRAEITGTVKACILYIPDGERGVRRLNAAIPFTCRVDGREITPDTRLVVRACLQSIETRLLNPRKVLTRAEVLLFVSAFRSMETEICSDVAGGEKSGVELLRETQNAYMIVCVREKDFTFVDELNLSGSKPGAEEILRTHVTLAADDVKIIGNKLVLKGTAHVAVFYRGEDGEMSTGSFDLPFSQIMEVEGADEDADCAVVLLLSGAECEIGGESDPDDRHTMIVTLNMKAQAVVSQNRRVDLISDLYSTAFDLSAEAKPYAFLALTDKTSRRQTVRETMEAGEPARMVLDASVRMGAVTQSREGGKLVLSAEAMVAAIYMGEDGELYELSRRIPVSCQMDVPEDCACTASASAPGEVFASPASSGIEVRFTVDFDILVVSSRKTTGITGVRMDSGAPRDTSGQPSVILRMVGGRERLWDIAKKHRTTVREIMTANGLEEESAAGEGRLLLIPKKR